MDGVAIILTLQVMEMIDGKKDNKLTIATVPDSGVKSIRVQLTKTLLRTWRATSERERIMVRKLYRKLTCILLERKVDFRSKLKRRKSRRLLGEKREGMGEVLEVLHHPRAAGQAAVEVAEVGS